MTRALILIDIQTGFDAPVWGTRNNPDAETNAGVLLETFRKGSDPVIHIRHVSREPDSPLGPDTGGTDFKPEVTPRDGETIFEKSVNSAFIGTNLENHLRAIRAETLMICGLTTPHCVSTTTRMAANLGFEVFLVHDACAAFSSNADTSWSPALNAPNPSDIHDAAISQLHGEFAQAVSVHDIAGSAW